MLYVIIKKFLENQTCEQACYIFHPKHEISKRNREEGRIK